MTTSSALCERLVSMYSPAVMAVTFAKVKSVADCLTLQEQGEPVLLSIIRQGEVEERRLLAVIRLNIIELDRFLHLNNPLSAEEAEFIATQIVDEFGGALTMADIHLVIKDIKAGRYGKLYERLSAPDLLGWFREYYDRRLDMAYDHNLNEDKKALSRGGCADVQKRLDVLKSLGYRVEDGRLVYDEDGHFKFDAERMRQTDEKRREIISNTDEEYSRYKAELYQKNLNSNN